MNVDIKPNVNIYSSIELGVHTFYHKRDNAINDLQEINFHHYEDFILFTSLTI